MIEILKIIMKKILMKKILMKKILMNKVKCRMCFAFIFKALWLIWSDSLNTHITYVTHITCIFFKAFKKTNENIFYNFLLFIKMPNKYYQKTKESSKKKHVKGIKVFLKKKQRKTEKSSWKMSECYWRRKRKKASIISWT